MGSIWRYEFRRTTLLLFFCIAIITGIGVSYWNLALQPFGLCSGAGVAMVVLTRYKFIGLLGVVIVGLVLGSWQGTKLVSRLSGYDELLDTKVSLQVSASEDAVYGKNGQLSFVAVHITNLETGERLPGKIGVSGIGMNAIYQADEIIVEGKLREGIGAYQGFMSYAALELVDHHPAPVSTIRRNFAAAMQSTLPEPMASFGMGILVGQRATLPEDVKEDLQRVGLTHIIAVSGANLTIMLEASRKLLGNNSKRLSTLLTLSLMAFFVLMTGGSASIIRAAYVSSFSIAAAYYGRRMRPLLIIMLVAAITGFINPIYVWGDASWYLSFLAFYGVLMVSPLFQKRLPAIFSRSIILGVALESICAEVMSVPYILFTFGQMSFVGLPANVLVVALIPLAMLLSFIAGLAGMFLSPMSGWFAWPAKFLLMYMLDTAHVLAHVPNVFNDNLSITLPGLITLYTIIVVTTALLTFKDQANSGKITDKKSFDTS